MESKFPPPEYIGTRRFWRLSALLRFEGRPRDADALSPVDDIFLPSARVRERYGGISQMTLHRWTNARDGEAA
jgi:hypothetical protein